MKPSLTVLVLIAVASHAMAEPAGSEWFCTLLSGAVYNIPVPLTVRQSGYDDISLTARYSTRPMETPQYYVFRAERWKNDRAWRIELIHHKLFLKNKPDHIQRFFVTHGYNLVTVSRAWKLRGFICQLGAGCVLAHPETTIRGRAHSEREGLFRTGYYFSGPVVEAGVGKRVRLTGKLFAAVECVVTGSFASFPVSGGKASVTNVAVHLLAGMGYRF